MRTRVEGLLLEETTIAPGNDGARWDYQPLGPFKVQRYHVSARPEFCMWHTVEYLSEALTTFAMLYLPVRPRFALEIVDERFVSVLRVSKLTEVAEALGAAWGVGAAFELAEELGDICPVTLAIWEMNARKTAPGGQ